MSGPRRRSRGAGLLAVVCAAALGLMSMLTSAYVFGVKAIIAEAVLLAEEGWIMGGTGNPIPDPGYIAQVEGL